MCARQAVSCLAGLGCKPRALVFSAFSVRFGRRQLRRLGVALGEARSVAGGETPMWDHGVLPPLADARVGRFLRAVMSSGLLGYVSSWLQKM